MRRTFEIDEISGFNDSPVAGYFITSGSRDFVAMGVKTTTSTITNVRTAKSGPVTSVVGNRIGATTVYFKSGDFFYVSLPSDWTLQTSDGPVIDIECRMCGFSFPKKELIDGKCKVCQDES